MGSSLVKLVIDRRSQLLSSGQGLSMLVSNLYGDRKYMNFKNILQLK